MMIFNISDLNMSFGDLMKIARQRASLSARALSSKIDASPSYVSKMERGEYLPTLDTFARLSNSLDLSDAEILFLVKMLA
jgi:ribosome-binding protein aMBF1 (putative translation factor)